MEAGSEDPACTPAHKRGGLLDCDAVFPVDRSNSERQDMRTAIRSALVATAVVATILGAISPGAANTPTVDEIGKGASWLADQLEDGKMASTWNPGTTDWGLTADTIFALTSRKVSGTAADAATDALATNVLSYISPGEGAARSAGGVAKTLLVAVTQGRNPNAFGGQDLVATLESMQSSTGANAGRYSDVGTVNDYSSAFSQSLAIIALSRLGRLSESSVGFLLDMQCANGGFPYSPSFTTSRCDSNADVDNDATSMAIQALSAPGVAAVPGAAAARSAAGNYLIGAQKASGAFDAPPWIEDNASTTGLAAAALRLAGETTAADKATAWLAPLQLTCTNGGKASAHAGAIAADPATLALLKSGGVDNGNADQLRRSTSQAVLGFSDSKSFITMDRAFASDGGPDRTCPAPVVPARPKLVSISFAHSMRTATVVFDSGASSDVLIRSRNTRGAWTGWRGLRSRTPATVATGSIVQAIARKNSVLSTPVTTPVVATRRIGALRGCAPIGAVVVRYPSTRAGMLTFPRRASSCALASLRAGAGWRAIRQGQAAIAVPMPTGASLVRIRTGNQLVVLSLTVPR